MDKKSSNYKRRCIMKKYIFSIVLFTTLLACSVEPEPINYGSDICEYCHMTIVDQQHAAEIVTKKGRTYKFDAIECMVNYLKTIDDATVQIYLITDYTQPGKLVDATSAIFLISRNIPSPMGAFLLGAINKEDAEKLQREHDGTLYTWDELIRYFKDTEGVINRD